MDQGWEYRWGDSPFTADGIPVWTQETGADRWSPIAFPSNPPGRGSRTNVWYRVILPDGDWRDPVLYVFSVDLIVEVYLDGRKIYQFGHFDDAGKGRFEGWPWHMIPLPVGCSGKPLYFRLYSDYMDIGLWGQVRIMERVDLFQEILRNSIERLITSGFSILIAFLSLIFGLFNRGRGNFIAIALFSLASGCLVLSGSQLNLLLIDRPLFWDYMGAIGYFTIPVAMAILLERWLKPARVLLVSVIWRFHLLYLIGAVGLSLMGLVSLADTYPLFDGCFAISLTLLLIPAAQVAARGSTDHKAILTAYAVLSLLLLLDMAVAHNLVRWFQVPVAWGALAFSLAIVIISLRHYARTQTALRAMNVSLEHEVRKRTAALARLVRRERQRAKMLGIENQKRAELEKILSDLQNSGGVSEANEILIHCLPALCRPLAGAYYQRDEREGAYRLLDLWLDPSGPDRAQPPALVPVTEVFRLLSDDNHWRLSVLYEDPRHGERELGMLWLRIPEARGDGELSDTGTPWRQLIELGLEKIGLVFSQLSLHSELRRLSYEDGLTGVKNRRFLDEVFERETALAKRHGRSLSVIMCDVDLFKRFNDTYGHAAGDIVLKRLAALLASVFRQTDLVCRYGGEEFCVLMPGTQAKDCRQRAEDLRQRVESESFEYEGHSLGPITVSVGIAVWPEMPIAPETLILFADQALYRAKQSGRNRVEIYIDR
ncbi:diguanylate cyclase [Thiorhodococcus fuscus]|uniref:diguanylate cyclase n=1 Tax=Thiorhodococcus fuscus TaxID=527200 RepID=A0ABW4Y3B5_9GAMM